MLKMVNFYKLKKINYSIKKKLYKKLAVLIKNLQMKMKLVRSV
jgi:hypothetical protein